MKQTLYLKLAWHGISKNKKTYLPFMLTSVGITMMYYIISYLTYSKSVYEMRGGQEMQMILSFGTGVVAVFAVIFLFYMNSFLMRRRKTEFGLYNILGMGKKNIMRILLWQTVLLLIVSMAGGIGLGLLFSKLSELCAAKIMGVNSPLGFSIEPMALRNTIILMLVCFGITFVYSLGQIHLSNPIALLHGEKTGEKPPKARWFFALIGTILLCVAYYLAVSIQDPITALTVFFVAVVLVIVATYLLFICGSVTLCKILQKNKHYYYKTSHFVSVSSMSYRMKRNGASLASICILSTAVLVMISASLCLFIGSEEALHNRYPRDIEITCNASADTDAVKQIVTNTIQNKNISTTEELEFTSLSVAGYLEDDYISMDINYDIIDYSNVIEIDIFTLDEYNRLSGDSQQLSDGEILLHMYQNSYDYDTFQIGDMATMNIKKQVEGFVIDELIKSRTVIGSMFIVVADKSAMQDIYTNQKRKYEENASEIQYFYGCNLNADTDTQIAIQQEIADGIAGEYDNIENLQRYSCRGLEEARYSYYSLYGGLLFLGLLLSIVFLFGTVLIMYYKQISEGYEDASRFEIMQKVGMTKQEIKKSINSQVLIIFAAPLLAAGIHTGFAFPLVQKLLTAFGLTNIPLLISITVGSFLIFTILYVIMYRLTSHVYYHLVK